MKYRKIEKLFEKHSEEFLCFERIENPLHKRPDICALLYLDKLQPGNNEFLTHSTFEFLYLEVDLDSIEITDKDVIYLLRCGVTWDSFYGDKGKMGFINPEKECD